MSAWFPTEFKSRWQPHNHSRKCKTIINEKVKHALRFVISQWASDIGTATTQCCPNLMAIRTTLGSCCTDVACSLGFSPIINWNRWESHNQEPIQWIPTSCPEHQIIKENLKVAHKEKTRQEKNPNVSYFPADGHKAPRNNVWTVRLIERW